MPESGAYLYIDCGQGMGDPLDPFGFVFHDEDCQLCERIADLLQNQVYNEGAILSVQSADEIGDAWTLADEELAYKEAQLDGTEEWDGQGLTWWARTIRGYAQKIRASDRRVSRLQNSRGVKSNSSSPLEVSDSSAEQEHRREVQESLATKRKVRTPGELLPNEKKFIDLLHGRAMTAAELAAPNRLNTSELTIYQWKKNINRKRPGLIKHSRDVGYYRTDAEPDWASLTRKRRRQTRPR